MLQILTVAPRKAILQEPLERTHRPNLPVHSTIAVLALYHSGNDRSSSRWKQGSLRSMCMPSVRVPSASVIQTLTVRSRVEWKMGRLIPCGVKSEREVDVGLVEEVNVQTY